MLKLAKASGAFGVLVLMAMAMTNIANAATFVLSGSAPAAVVSKPYYFKPTISGASGQQIRWQVQNRPAWIVFNYWTGALTGTPPSSELGKTFTLTINGVDGYQVSNLTVYVKVISGTTNTAPTISGTPATKATVGTAYSFVPTAKDANGDAIAFSIVNKPVWASFNTATGALTGKPTATGTFANIVISVSDGKVKTSLPAFTITVAPAVVYKSVTLSWNAPTLNDDNSPLTNLAGYRVMYGTAANALTQKLEVAGQSVTSARIEQLPAGTYFFAVKAYRTDGIESVLTPIVWKTL